MLTEIPFVVDAPPAGSSGGTKGVFRAPTEQICKLIPVDVLRNNLQQISSAMLTALDDLKAVGSFRLSEVELQAEVTAEGGVQFIGTATLGGKGAITLKFVAPE